MKEILKDYKKGDTIEGEITGVADFGAFIKFPVTGEAKGEIEGLIHISELDWQLVENPAEVVKVGEIVKAQIIDINKNQVFQQCNQSFSKSMTDVLPILVQKF